MSEVAREIPRKIRELVKEEVIPSLAVRMEKVLPRKKPDYSATEKELVQIFEKPFSSSEIKNERAAERRVLYGCFNIIFKIATPLKNLNLTHNFFTDKENEDTRYPIEVTFHPFELPILYKSLYLLATAIGDSDKALSEVYEANEIVAEQGESYISFSLLETMSKLGVLDHKDFYPFAAVLRKRIILKSQFAEISAIQKNYKGQVISNTAFWQEGYRLFPRIQFPDEQTFLREKREIATEKKTFEG